MAAMNQVNMATSGTFYLDASSLSSATVVYSNEALTVVAADGFYSNGLIVRQQLSGTLLPAVVCTECATPCGTTINADGGQGIYLLNLETGTTVSNVGAVIVRFNPYSVPDGIVAVLGSNVYNKLTSPVDGFHQSSNVGALTFVGQTSDDCGISGTTYPALTEFVYNGTAFVSTGGTQSITVAAGDVSLSSSAPSNTMMVIPKLTPLPSIINFEVVGPCSGTEWQMSVACPVLLTGFSSSVAAETSDAACELSETTIYYNASLANTPGTVGLYDFVFADAFGNTPLAAGFYYAAGSISGGNEWFEIDENGVVISIGICGVPPSICVNSFGASMTPCQGGTQDDHMEGFVSLSSNTNVDAEFTLQVGYLPGVVGGDCNNVNTFIDLFVTVPAGTNQGLLNCTNGAPFIDGNGATICSVTITNGPYSLCQNL